MNRLFLISLAVLLSIPFCARAQEDKVVGKWLNEDNTAHIRVFKATNGRYYGKIEWLKTEPERLDVNNPDETKRSEPMLGLMILKGFQYEEAKEQWNGGTIYDPDNGKTYDCYMWLEGEDNLSIKGYVLGMKFVGRSTVWTKVKE